MVDIFCVQDRLPMRAGGHIFAVILFNTRSNLLQNDDSVFINIKTYRQQSQQTVYCNKLNQLIWFVWGVGSIVSNIMVGAKM